MQIDHNDNKVEAYPKAFQKLIISSALQWIMSFPWACEIPCPEIIWSEKNIYLYKKGNIAPAALLMLKYSVL
jgi:hypothetical protein